MGRHCVPGSIKATFSSCGREVLLAVLSSSIDRDGAEFRANSVRMRALVADLQERRAEAALGGSEKARERHVGRGKLLPRDRVMNLIDPGSPFLEFSPLAANGMYEDAIHGAGLITGIGRIEAGNAWWSAMIPPSKAAPITR
jgi:Acetyl-CoA carboxylase, carboxyltransferase component (subunits alpha and beta)